MTYSPTSPIADGTVDTATITLNDSSGNPVACPALTVGVKHATRQDNGGWLVGCALLNPLSDEQLHDLLAS